MSYAHLVHKTCANAIGFPILVMAQSSALPVRVVALRVQASSTKDFLSSKHKPHSAPFLFLDDIEVAEFRFLEQAFE